MTAILRPPYRFTNPVWTREGKLHVGNYWEFYSLKLGKDVAFYSDLEYDHGILLEADPEVLSYCVQPIIVSAFVYGKLRHSRLDAWVLWKDGREMFREVKHAKDIEDSLTEGGELSAQLAVQKDWSARNHEPYHLITEEEIRAWPFRLQNWKYILHFLKVNRGIVPAAEHVSEVGRLVKEQPHRPFPIWYLHDRVGRSRVSEIVLETIVYRKLHSGEFIANLNNGRLTHKTLISARSL